jgi:hypothetical protein
MNNRIFISGRITGDPSYKLKFESASIHVSSRWFFDRHGDPSFCYRYGYFGFMPVDPCDLTILGEPLSSWPWLLCMLRTLWAMAGCSYVYMLHDWPQSRGAKWEHRVARWLRKTIIYQ